MATKTNIGLVAYAKAQLGRPYWYGCFGQKGTSALLTSKARQYPALYTAGRVANARKQYGVKVHDCVGLIKGYLWSDNAEDLTPTYNAAQDKSANGMYNACKERGTLATMPDLAGVLVFMNGHVGVYIGGGYVIEARGFSSGVVKTKLAGRGWTKWGKCPYITYTAKATVEKETTSSTKKPTANKTTASKKADKFLPERGYFKKGDVSANVGKIATFMRKTFPSYTSEKALGNTYGDNLIKAVKEFQKRTGLEADGYFGKLTLAALEKHGFEY